MTTPVKGDYVGLRGDNISLKLSSLFCARTSALGR